MKGFCVRNFKTIPIIYYRKEEIIALEKKSHYIITKTGYQGPDFTTLQSPLVKDLLKDRIPLKNFYMSDGSMVSLFEGGAVCGGIIRNLIHITEIGDRTGEISCKGNSVVILPGVNNPSKITLALNNKYNKMEMTFSFNTPEKIPINCRDIDGEIGLTINADGKKIYQEDINYKKEISYQLDLRKTDNLEIIVDKGKNGPDCDWFLIRDIKIY